MLAFEQALTISQIITGSTNIVTGMEKLANFIRPLFIFDNLVVYSLEGCSTLDVVYAKSAGRGKSKEADIAWGEVIANQVVHTKKLHYQKPDGTVENDRLKQAHILAIPLTMADRLTGVTVFIRYGGPKFEGDEVNIAAFIGTQITWLLEGQKMDERAKELDAQHQAIQLQEDFVNTISHDLQNPLGFIKGYTTTLMRSDANFDKATQKEFLEIIDNETDHLSELISNLLDSARIQSGQFHVDFHLVRIDALIKETIKKFQLHHPDSKISLHLGSKIDNLKVDSNRLAQVLDNLLDNAARYAPGSEVKINVTQEEKWVLINVQDFGPGIEARYLPHIFERFFRTPESRMIGHGTGLGLYICKQILDAHKGKIEVKSKPGIGSTFTMILPRNFEVITNQEGLISQ